MLASEALSELSRLSTYSPSAVGDSGRSGPAPLVRRQPAATPAAQVPPPAAPSERRQRSAADVRSMLSGFTSGVSRARSGEDDTDGEPRSLVPAGPGGALGGLTGRPLTRPGTSGANGTTAGPGTPAGSPSPTSDTDARPTDGGPRP
jgi:hypothetical protein